MEPVSGIASALSILEATARLSKATTEFYRNFRDAPRELAQLCANITQIQSRINTQLHVYQNLSGSGCSSNILPANALQVVETDLRTANSCLDSIRGSMVGKWDEPDRKQRLTWVVKDKRHVTKMLQVLGDVDSNLSAFLGTVTL
ncbi:MAG: hypothetical protein L6R41_003331 [Letrouitia leprolyta]|nr:MAG: hypothetical protein L6R41_003331 [Letrouitia leprolyta]